MVRFSLLYPLYLREKLDWNPVPAACGKANLLVMAELRYTVQLCHFFVKLSVTCIERKDAAYKKNT